MKSKLLKTSVLSAGTLLLATGMTALAQDNVAQTQGGMPYGQTAAIPQDGNPYAQNGSQYPQGGMAQPGAINYTEGMVYVNGESVRGSVNAQVQAGQVLETRDGKAEMLLTPGVFFRLNNNSEAKLLSSSITDLRVQLLKGQAMIEAAQIAPENNFQMMVAGFSTVIAKPGLYEFNADQPMVSVYDGQVNVRDGDRYITVKKGHQLSLVETAKMKTTGFDTKNTDALYSWSKLRSQYMANANMATAQTIVVDNPGWFYGTGWYWNPYFGSWAFVPGGGFFDSPFGFGFYSPVYWAYNRPYIWGHGYGYYGYRGFNGYRGGASAFRSAPTPAFRGGSGGFTGTRSMGGFSGGAGRMGGGGFGGGGGHMGGGGRR